MVICEQLSVFSLLRTKFTHLNIPRTIPGTRAGRHCVLDRVHKQVHCNCRQGRIDLVREVVLSWIVTTSTEELHVRNYRHLDVLAFVLAGGELIYLDQVGVVTVIVLVTTVSTREMTRDKVRMS